jgi:hypothetical protein
VVNIWLPAHGLFPAPTAVDHWKWNRDPFLQDQPMPFCRQGFHPREGFQFNIQRQVKMR